MNVSLSQNHIETSANKGAWAIGWLVRHCQEAIFKEYDPSNEFDPVLTEYRIKNPALHLGLSKCDNNWRCGEAG